MSIKDGTYKFKLSKELEYKFKGSTRKTDFVVLKEPVMGHIKFYSKLKQMVTRVQMELAEQYSKLNKMREDIGDVVKPMNDTADRIEDEADDTFQALSLGMQSSEKVDLSVFIEIFRKMILSPAKKSICLVNGDVVMTDALWDKLEPDCALDMAVRWCAFFAMPSEGGRKTSYDQPSESHTEPVEA